MTRYLVRLLFTTIIAIAYAAYRAEGVNALLILMPAKLIAPTLRRYGATIGEHVEIHSPLLIHNASTEKGKHYQNLFIGSHSHIGRDVFFDLRERITIEEYVTVSMRCTLICHTDVGNRPRELKTLTCSSAPIVIQQGAYLGAGSTILEGVTIGRCSVVGAGALVRDSVSARQIVAGVPAKPIGIVQPDPQAGLTE